MIKKINMWSLIVLKKFFCKVKYDVHCKLKSQCEIIILKAHLKLDQFSLIGMKEIYITMQNEVLDHTLYMIHFYILILLIHSTLTRP